MIGSYVDVIKVNDSGFVFLSNGDFIFYSTFQRSWVVEYDKSGYIERLINLDESSCKTYADAIESYQKRTLNCVCGPLDTAGVEHILDKKYNWS